MEELDEHLIGLPWRKRSDARGAILLPKLELGERGNEADTCNVDLVVGRISGPPVFQTCSERRASVWRSSADLVTWHAESGTELIVYDLAPGKATNIGYKK